MTDRLKEIRERLGKAICTGDIVTDSKNEQEFHYNSRSDIEYLLSEVERLQSANNAIMETIMNDFYATQFQTLGQYRSALIKGAKQALNQHGGGDANRIHNS